MEIGSLECAWTFFNKTHIDCVVPAGAVIAKFDPYKEQLDGLPLTVPRAVF